MAKIVKPEFAFFIEYTHLQDDPLQAMLFESPGFIRKAIERFVPIRNLERYYRTKKAYQEVQKLRCLT